MSDILLRAAIRAQSAITGLRDREEGQTMTEYAIIIAAVAVLLIVALLFLSGRIGDLFSDTEAASPTRSTKAPRSPQLRESAGPVPPRPGRRFFFAGGI